MKVSILWLEASKEQKRAAHIAVHKAKLRGDLPRPQTLLCADGCGRMAMLYHHEDYAESKQLDVDALCGKCHRQRHDSLAAGNHWVGRRRRGDRG